MKVSTSTNFVVGLSTEEEEEEDGEEEEEEIGVLVVFRACHCSGLFYLLAIISGTELLLDQVMCLKRIITAAFGQFCMLRLMGVSAPSLHRESTDSLTL